MADFDAKKVMETVKDKSAAAGKFVAEKSVAAGHFVKEKAPVAGRFVAEKATVAGKFVAEKSVAAGHFVKEKAPVAGSFIKEKSIVVASATKRTAANIVWEVKAAPDRTFDYDRNDIEQNKLLSMLSYVSFLVLVPLFLPRFTGKQSPYMSFHAKQGLVLLIIEIINNLVLGLLSKIWLIGYLFSAIMIIIDIVCIALSIKSIWDVLNGKAVKLPYIDRLDKLFPKF